MTSHDSAVTQPPRFDTATCVAPDRTQGYMVTEAALRKAIFDVKAQCAPGFTGALGALDGWVGGCFGGFWEKILGLLMMAKLNG